MRPLPRLIALTPGTLLPAGDGPGSDREFLARVEAAVAAGLRGVLVREPRRSDAALLALGRALAALRACVPDLWLGLHDRAHLAPAVGVDAVHLSFRSLRPAELRAWLPRVIALGLSTHATDDPRTWAGADYLFHGPLHATASKPAAVPVGFGGLARAARAASVPLLALGGVRPEDQAPVRAAGAHGVAVLAGIFGAADPARATRAYLEASA